MKSMFFIFILVRFYLLVWQFLSCCFFSFFFFLVSGLWVIKAYTYSLVVTELFHCFPWNNETQSGSSCIFRAIWVEMAATGASFVKVKRHIVGFTTVLKSVACEFYFFCYSLILYYQICWQNLLVIVNCKALYFVFQARSSLGAWEIWLVILVSIGPGLFCSLSLSLSHL